MKDQAAWFIAPEQQEQQALEAWRGNATVTRIQFKTALDDFGYLEQIEALMADPETQKQTRLDWKDADDFRRSSPIIAQISESLGLSEEEVDRLFKHAETVKG